MSLTKPQKKFILDNSEYLTLFELSDRTGIDQKEISAYLKKNGVKPIVSTDKVSLKKADSSANNDPLMVKSTILTFFGVIKENWIFLSGLIVAVVLLYLNAMHGDYVSDDYATVVQNPDLKNVSLVLNSRPFNMALLLKSIMANIFNPSTPNALHAFSLFSYVLVLIAAFVLIRTLFDKTIAMFTIILFASLPVHVEAVSWISGAPYLHIALTILLFLIQLVFYLQTKSKKNLVFMVVLLFFVFMTERFRGFSVVLLSFSLLMSFKFKYLKKINYPLVIGIFVLVTGIGAMISWPLIMERVNAVNGGYNATDSIFYKPWEQYPTSITKYLQLMFVPTDLTLYHTMYVIPVALNWMVFLLYIAMCVYFFFKNKKIFFALTFIFLASAGSMSPVKVSWLVAERYIFLGSLGFSLFIILFFKNLFLKYSALFISLFILLVSVYSWRTWIRNVDWQTNHLLWVATVQTSPNSHNAWNNIGDDYDKLGDLENSVKGFTQSVIVKPNYADAYHNRANIFFKAGRLDLARESYITALNYSPGLYQTYISLAQLELQDKNIQGALSWSQKLLQIQPNNPQAYYIYGIILGQAGAIDEAKKAIQMSLKLQPNYEAAAQVLQQLNALK